MLVPRAESAYLGLRRQAFQRRRHNPNENSYFHSQRSLNQIKQKSEGLRHARSRNSNKAFLRQSERYIDQVKDRTLIPFNLRLKKLAKDRNWRGAVDCLREIQQQGLIPDEISYATAIDACSKALKSRPAVMLFEEMKTNGIRPNVPIYNAVMNACARDHQWKQSLGFLDDMRANGIQPNIVSYNVCLSALEKSKKWNIAVDLMKKIRESDVPLQAITYNTVISACAKSRKMKVCEDLFEVMKSDGFQPDAFTYSSLLNGYRKIRDGPSIFRLCEEMREKGVPFDAVIYSTVIGACADLGKNKQAFEMFEEMKETGVRPNEIVYSCVLRACSSVEKVDSLLREMADYGVKKNTVVFTSAINVSHKVGGVQNAIRWFDQMLSEGIKPDWVAYMSLFEVLSTANEVSLLDKYYEQGLENGVLDHYSKNKDFDTVTVDLHGWSTALSRAALRNVMADYQQTYDMGNPIQPMVVLTGKGYSKNQPVLRPAVTKMLETQFEPALHYSINSSGEIRISEKTIINWIEVQNETEDKEIANILQEMTPQEEYDSEDLIFPIYRGPSLSNPFTPFFEIPPTHFPGRVSSRSRWMGENNPLNETHVILGRDQSPPVAYVQTQPADKVSSEFEEFPDFYLPGFFKKQFLESNV